MWSQLRTAIGDFLMEFAALESMAMTELIGALSADPTLVKHLDELLDLEKKTTLIRRLLEYYSVSIPVPLVSEIRSLLNTVKKLQERRNEVAHNTSALLKVGETTSAGVQRPYSKRPLPTSRWAYREVSRVGLRHAFIRKDRLKLTRRRPSIYGTDCWLSSPSLLRRYPKSHRGACSS